MKTFQESLAIGEEFEVQHAQTFLLNQFSDFYLIPTHNFQTKAGYQGGPRIISTGEAIVMPDFMLVSKTDPNVKLLVEAKWKKNVFHLPGARQAYAIEEHRCLDYEKAATILGASLIYLIGCEETRTIHLYARDNYVNHTFCNRFTYNKPVPNRCFLALPSSVVGMY